MEFDKICGIILGHSLGDALGSPHEFYPHGTYTGKLEFIYHIILNYHIFFFKHINCIILCKLVTIYFM